MSIPLFRLPSPSTLGRRTQLMELGMVLVVTWLPTLYALALGIPVVGPASPAQEIQDSIYDLGLISLVVYLLWRDRGALGAVGLVGTPWKELVYGALILVPAFLASTGTLMTGIQWFGFDEPLAERGPSTSLLPVTLFVSAVAEEILFRCYLWVRLVDLTGRPAISLILSNLLFCAVHGYGAAGSLAVFVSGCVWSLFYWATARLPRLVVAHWAENMVRSFFL